MKTIGLFIHFQLIFCLCLLGQVNQKSKFQNGYVKNDGKYVGPHYKTAPNKTNIDNYSTKTNLNPYTGKKGTKAKDYSNEAYNYGKGKDIKTGTKGGQYYESNKNRKTYVPKRNQ